MNLPFSQRYGYKSARGSFQIEEMDLRLKTGLWNVMQLTCFKGSYNLDNRRDKNNTELISICISIWTEFFKKRFNELPRHWIHFEEELQRYLFDECSWFEVYDLIEFINNDQFCPSDFKEYINAELEKEMSAYRLIDGKITPYR